MTRHLDLRAARLALPLLGVPLAALPLPTLAGTDTDTLSVTATVQNACALNGGAMSFGQYLSGQAGDLNVNGQINYVNCNGTISFELDGGQSGNVSARKMKSGANELNYQLFRNNTRTAVFGQGADKQEILLLTPLSGKVDVFGRIPGGQAVPAGDYSDIVNVTLTFN
jgi:spore coat protein U-like protein